MRTRSIDFSIETILVTFGTLILAAAYILSSVGLFQVEILRGIGIVFIAVIIYLVYLNKHWIRLNAASCILVIFCICAFSQGILSVPTTTDAHNYHIPRAMYWLQYHTLYQTFIHTSHDFMGPFPSILLAFFYSLTNSDVLLFFPQWISYVLIFFLVGKIAKLLQYTSMQTQAAQLLTLSLPIATLQASSVQSDLLVAVWVLVSTIFALRYVKERAPVLLFLCTIAVFIGFLTKATMVIYAAIPVGIIGWNFIFNRSDWFSMIKIGFTGILFGLLLCAPHLLQNKRIFDSFLGTSYTIDGESIPFMVSNLSVAGSVENIYRNIFMHFPFFKFASTLDQLVKRLEPLGISLALSDSSWFNSKFFHQNVPIPQEDIAPAPLHLILILVTILLSVRKKIKATNPSLLLFILGICSFLFFCILLRWQPYHIRQQMSILFILIVSGIGLLNPSKTIYKLICIISVGVGFLVLISNVSRPLISYQPLMSKIAFAIPSGFTPPDSVLQGRNESNYYLSRPYWRPAYLEMINYLQANQIKKVAFTGREGYVYPFYLTALKHSIEVVPGADQNAPVIVIAGLLEDQRFDKAAHCVQTADANKVICVYFNP